MNRQRMWQIRMRAEGKCPKCGKDTDGKYYCEYHRMKEREKYQRRKARKGKK